MKKLIKRSFVIILFCTFIVNANPMPTDNIGNIQPLSTVERTFAENNGNAIKLYCDLGEGDR